MKKLMSIALTVFSSLASASNLQEPQQISVETKPQQPTALIRVLDTSVKPYKVIEGKKLSRSKPRQVCLHVLNVPIQEQNLFAQYVRAPGPIKVNAPRARVQMEDNQKDFLIVFNMMKKEIDNNIPTQCWTLGKNDPIGKYKLDIQFNDIVFKDLEFKLLK